MDFWAFHWAFWIGKGDVRACLPDGTGCGPWRFFDRSITEE